ncbi:MAG TPA: helix-turn-helix transcriptional regulator [Caproicibacter sp.]|nr:helix-turn-helix transcriptional regulator [Caproicibacter sp.]
MLRERKKYSQKRLAELLIVSDKSVSKWETGKGLPDISLIESLAKTLSVSVAELLSGKYIEEHYISFLHTSP